MTEQEIQQIVAQLEGPLGEKLRALLSPRLQEWQRDAIAAEPKGFMADLLHASRHRSDSASMISDKRRPEDKPRPPDSGGTAEVKPPPGINFIDQMCEAQSRADRAAAVKVRIDQQLAEAIFNDRTPRGPRSDYDPFSRDRMAGDDE